MVKGKRSGIARMACTVGLTAAVTFAGLPFGAVPAWAAGTVTVTPITSNEGVTYQAYQLFSGTIEKGEDGKETLSGVSWATGAEEVFKAVIGGYAGQDGHPAYTGTTAQDAADYLTGELGASDNTTVLTRDSLAWKLADKLQDEVAPAATFKAGEASDELADGYYLIATKADTLTGHQAATAPVYTLAGGDDLTINEKASVPTITKEVQEDSTGEYGHYADAQVGQAVNYRLTATLPTDYANYTSYQLKFVDYLSEGLTYNGDAKVYVQHQDLTKEEVTGQFNTGTSDQDQPDTDATDKVYNQQKALVFNGGDIKSVTLAGDAHIVATDKIVVEYSAQLNGDAVVGTPGNPNKAKLVYSNNPHSSGTGETELVDPVVYTYRLKLLKQDKDKQGSADGGSGLAGATFTIKLIEADGTADTDSAGKYLQEDGTLGSEAHPFTTDESGLISVARIDAGTYEIEETEPPTGYAKLSSKPSVKITSNRGEDGTLVVKAEATGNADTQATLDESDTAGGTVEVTMRDVKNVGMPQTGSTGFVALIAGGTGLVGASLAALRRRNKKARG